MATMAMATVKRINYFHTFHSLIFTLVGLAFSLTLPAMVNAEGWEISPNVGIEETYTDNVELDISSPTSSLVSQVLLGLDAEYSSRSTTVDFSATNSHVFYSHNSDLNDDFWSVNALGEYDLWTDGLTFFIDAGISNVNRNGASNSLADLVSGDTIQFENYRTGFNYNIVNSSYQISSSLFYRTSIYEDDIGGSDGVALSLNTKNGNAARNIFWSLSGIYNEQENGTTTSTIYNIDAQIGAITSIKLNPFVRFYDEDISGSAFGTTQATTRSWGPGIRWQASDHFYFDVSYNFVADKTASDDYIATNINWQPSQRTSLIAGYSQRFFGDSYNLDFSHKTKRLTNKISYDETIEIYDRDDFEEVPLGQFWCPVGGPFNTTTCFPEDQPPGDTTGFILVPLSGLEPVESNQFTLNKRLSWNSTLALSRTTFNFNIATREREGLSTGSLDEHFDISLSATRKISPKSNLKLLVSLRDSVYGSTDTTEDNRQEDTYLTFSATYSKDLASSLTSFFTLQHVNRDSSAIQYNYDELRAIINITKDF